jgi:tetratricopeptide (TPR) repeat protein
MLLLALFAFLGAARASVSSAADSPTVASESSAARPTAELDAAEALLAAGRSREALARLQGLIPAWAGDARFDYLLALAAMDAGEPSVAVEALRRVLVVEPRFDGARLDLARALAASGDVAAARAEYERVRTASPSPVARGAAEQALAALAASSDAATPRRSRWIPSIVAGAGYDSNANAATTDGEFFGFTLNPLSIAQESGFIDVAAALQGEMAFGRGAGTAALRAGHRSYPAASFVDQSSVNAAVAFTRPVLGWAASLGVGGSAGWLDSRSHVLNGSIELSVARRVGRVWELAGLARGGQVDYRQPLFEQLDANRFLWGGALQRLELRGGAGRLGVALLGGRDEVRRSGSPWSNDRYGARLFGAWGLRSNASLYGELSWLTSDYFGGRGFFGIDRLDRQIVGLAGLEWQPRPGSPWVLSPALRWTYNASNVGLYEYDRMEVSLFVRREFR